MIYSCQYLTEYILFDLFDEKMPDYRSLKPKAGEGEQLIQIITSKFNELKQDLITKIKSLIQLEVKNVVKKKREEFNAKFLKIQERIISLELEKNDLKQYRRWVCVKTDNVLVESEEIADSVYEKIGEFLREACQDLPECCFARAHYIGPEYKS